MGLLPIAALLVLPTASPTRVVVYDLTLDVERRAARLFEGSLLAELQKLDGVQALGIAEVRAAEGITVIESLEADERCHERRDCLAQLADALDAEILVMGGIAQLGRSSIVTLKRLDLRTAELQQAVTLRLVRSRGEELLLALGGAVEQLFPERQVRVGEVRGVAHEVVARMSPPPLDSWVFFTGAGFTCAALATMTVMFVLQIDAQDRYANLIEESRTTVVSGEDLMAINDEAYAFNTAAYVALGIAGAFAIGTLLAFFFTDWEGDEAVAPMLTVGDGGVAAFGLAGSF